MEKIGLRIDEVMWRVFVCVVWFFEGEFTQLDQKIFVEMADDSDYHRSRTGSMIYDQFVRFENAKGRKFIGGFGNKCNSYPGEMFSSDFLLISSSENFAGKEVGMIEASKYFCNSLFVTFKSGAFASGPNVSLSAELFSEKILSQYIARKMKIDQDHVSMSGGPIVTESLLFNNDFVEYLAQIAINYIQNR